MLVGILGGGQLGRMLALAGYPLGLRFRCLDPASEAPMRLVAEHIRGDYEEPQTLQRFGHGLDVVSYEFENVPVVAARTLALTCPVYPPVEALAVAQDRLSEKTLFQQLGIPTPFFTAIDTRAGLDAALAEMGFPVVLKTRRFGYDGKGQAVLRQAEDVAAAWNTLGAFPLILEQFLSFDRELSLLAVRSRSGETVFYPLVENTHRDGILYRSIAPAPALTSELQTLAESYASRVLEALGYVGVLAVELFQVGNRLLANEMAPRVHNSGHWTIEGAETSQFENHLRAILGLPLGSPTPRGWSAMTNFIGEQPDLTAILQIPGVHLHLYDKAPRPGRKLGHLTCCAASLDGLHEHLAVLDSRLPG